MTPTEQKVKEIYNDIRVSIFGPPKNERVKEIIEENCAEWLAKPFAQKLINELQGMGGMIDNDQLIGDVIMKIPYYGWSINGMIERPSKVPPEDVFILRADVVGLIKSRQPESAPPADILNVLFRECVMRCQIAFPENEQDLKWFEDGLKDNHLFFMKVFNVLELGDDEKQYKQYIGAAREQEKQEAEIDKRPKPNFDEMYKRITSLSKAQRGQANKINRDNLNRSMDI